MDATLTVRLPWLSSPAPCWAAPAASRGVPMPSGIVIGASAVPGAPAPSSPSPPPSAVLPSLPRERLACSAIRAARAARESAMTSSKHWLVASCASFSWGMLDAVGRTDQTRLGIGVQLTREGSWWGKGG
eukprot:3611380-Rhodomonas_salina.2